MTWVGEISWYEKMQGFVNKTKESVCYSKYKGRH